MQAGKASRSKSQHESGRAAEVREEDDLMNNRSGRAGRQGPPLPIPNSFDSGAQ